MIAVRPLYRGELASSSTTAPPAEWMRYLSVPGGWGLSTAGALLFARIVNRVRALHRQHAIDVIHAHAPLPCGHAAMLLSQELGIPYVVSVHGLDAYSDVQVSGRAGQWCRRISQLVFRSAKRVICVSEHVREQVLNGGVSGGNTSVVYNGADPKMFIPASDTAPAQTIVLSVGNLIPTKGHEVLLWALDAIKAEYPDVTCEIVGTGPERDRLKDLARHLEIDNRVRFLGRLSRRDLAEAFRRCTLFVLPSYYEGLGCVYLEAMASERVAMGCRGQGIQEIIQHGSNGWLVDAGSSQDLANGLSALLSNPTLRATIASQGRRTVLQGLTLSHQAERQVAIYREMVV